jgi:hypothetical protein
LIPQAGIGTISRNGELSFGSPCEEARTG